jgi:hypothetical protein
MFHRRNLDTSQPSCSRDPAPPLLRPAQARLSFGSGLLTLFTHRGAVKTHLTRNRQLLTRARKGVPPQSQGSRICDHSSPIFSPIFSPISPIPLLSLQQRPFFLVPTPDILHPRMQNSANHEHRAGKRMLERTESRRADRGSFKGWALRGQVL